MGNWTIEARSLSIAGGVASHNFWVLRDDKGNDIAELHGLATDRKTGKSLPIGTDAEQHALRVKQFVHDENYARNFGTKKTDETYIKDGQRSEVVVSGSREEILERWKTGAKTAATLINAKDLDYPPYGFKIDGSTKNSNSVYNTLGAVMVGQINVPIFDKTLQPGVNNHVLSYTEIGLIQHDKPTFRKAQEHDGDAKLASVDTTTSDARTLAAKPFSANDELNRQFAQAMRGANGDRDVAAAAVDALRSAPGYKADQDIAVIQGRNGNLIATQGQGDTALNVAVGKVDPGEFERVSNRIAQTSLTTPTPVAPTEQPERARTV